MHYHGEIIMPPVAEEQVEDAVATIMKAFDEEPEAEDSTYFCIGDDRDENYPYNPHAFWDWYVIGGRWSGEKLKRSLDSEQYKTFNDELDRREITVSSVTSGKQTIMPAEQKESVDALWREYFPGTTEHCPLFDHAGDRLPGDIGTLGECPKELAACRVIIADAGGDALWMVEDSVWNGTNFQETDWSGKVWDAIDQWSKRVDGYQEEYRAAKMPSDEWLAVTVDYHI